MMRPFVGKVKRFRTLRVAYFLNAFPKLSETFVLREIIELKKQGVQVHIFSLLRLKEGTQHTEAASLIKETTYIADVGRRTKIKSLVYLLCTHPLRLVKTLGFVRRRRDRALTWSLKQSIYLARELRRRKVRHIHAHFALDAAEYAMLVNMLTGIPYSFAAHAVDIYVHQRLLREKMNYAKFIVTECNYNKMYLEQYNEECVGERIHVIRLGIDPAVFTCSNMAARVQKRDHPLHIVSVARLVEKKGLGHLIEALGLLKREGLHLQASIVGDGPERRALTELIGRHGLDSSVYLVGAKDTDGVQAYLREADVFVLPCIVAANGDRDATPTVLAEAMAMGVPVISTCVAGIPEVIPESAGVVVPPKDCVALAKAIKTIYRMGYAGRAEAGNHGREYVLKHCNLHEETKKLVGLFLAPDESLQWPVSVAANT